MSISQKSLRSVSLELKRCESISRNKIHASNVNGTASRATQSDLPSAVMKIRLNNELDKEAYQFESKFNSHHQARCNTSFHHFRYVVVMMSSFGVALMMMMRLGMTVSILSMVNHTHLYLETHENSTVDDFLAEGYKLGGDFNWNNEIVSIILSWYMIAYTVPQIFSTQLALRIGCHKAIVIALLICSVSMLLTPVCAHLGWHWVVAMRLLNGLGASPLCAINLHVIETWVRPDEISLALTLAMGVISMLTFYPLLIGYLTEIHWVYSFYVPALVSICFSLLWFFVAADRPELSRIISEREMKHLRRATVEMKPSSEGEQEQISWLRIFKVPSFYAFVITWTIYNCANHGYMFVLPTYLSQFLKIGIVDNGLYGTLIAAGCFAPVIWPHLMHKMLLKVGLSATGSRMVQQTVCSAGVALTWIYVGLNHENQIFAFFLNRCFFTANDVLFSAALMANYGNAGLSSLAYSIMNSISDILIVPTSTLIGWLLDYSGQSRQCWSWLFIGLGLSHAALWLIFLLFTDSEPVNFDKKVVAGGGATAKQADCESQNGTHKQQQQQQSQNSPVV